MGRIALAALSLVLSLGNQTGFAAIRYVEITGATAAAENGCPAWVAEGNADDCSYDASNPSALGSAQWVGPLFSAGYYAPGAAPLVFSNPPPAAPVVTPLPVLPPGGKTGIPISRGFISINDRDTPTPVDDVISGTIEFGPFERNVSTGPLVRNLERFERIIHRIVPLGGTPGDVGQATPNAQGGVDYVVGVVGGAAEFPNLLGGLADDFPSETASQSSPDAADTRYWAAPGSFGIARLEGAGAVQGASTRATIWGYQCIADDGGTACATNASNWEADLYARYRNVLMNLSTNASGEIISAAAFLVNEADQSIGIPGDDSWQATTLTFTGIPRQEPLAFDDRAILILGLDLSLSVPVVANDIPGVAPVTVQIAADPVSGEAEVFEGPSGTFIGYEPHPSAAEGVDTLTYRITDANSDTSTGILQIILTDPVTCQNDSTQVAQNEVATLAILDNDAGFDIPPVEVKIISAPAQGTAVINPDRSLTFTPPVDLGGIFTIRYELSDGTQEPARCDAVVQVEARPVAVDDTQPVRIDTVTDVRVLANDTGITDTPLTLSITASPIHGTALVVVPPGDTPLIRYTPTAGYVGNDTLRYRVSDTDGDESNEATVSITVFGPPESNPPSCTDDVVNTDQDTPVSIPVLDNDTGLDVLPITLFILQAPTQGTAVIESDNTITYTPPAGIGGQFSLRYQVREAINSPVECAAAILVNQVPIAADDTFSLNSGPQTAFTVLNNDQNLGDVPLNLEIVTPPQHGTTEILVAPNGFPVIAYRSDAGYAGPDSLQYQILDCASFQDIDENGFCANTRDASNVATVSITVNSTPEAVNDGEPFPLRTVRDEPIVVDVLANDFGLADGPITIEIVSSQNGSATVNPDNTVTFTPTGRFVGRWPTPGEIPIDLPNGRFQELERVDVRDNSGNLVFFGFISEIVPGILRIQEPTGPGARSEPSIDATVTGAVSGATARVRGDYVPVCQTGCASLAGGAGFRYRITDGDGEPDETIGSDNDSEGIVFVDVFPGPVTDSGGSALGGESLVLLTAAGIVRRRRGARGRNRTGTTR